MSSADVSGGASSAPKSNLYTRAGDAGTSVLFTGDRLAKSAPVFQSLGTLGVSQITSIARVGQYG
eukprot:m.41839 g.41839  ORF g.41839 m.41839 type:complete len:65 (+) comp11494_c0_seq2:196-390(+)